MSIFPVIERELRAVARHTLTYHLRVIGVLALSAILATFWAGGNNGPGMGGRLFAEVHCALFVTIWFLVPLMTADCISRERREGTLPLLFLTRLTHDDIIYAKGLAHGLRALTLWLAGLPVFTICFLGGGVSWVDVMISTLVNFGSICLALGAGVAASARARVWIRALAGAACFGLLFFSGFLFVLPWALLIFPATRLLANRLPADGFGSYLANGLSMAINDQDQWQRSSAGLKGGPTPLLTCYGVAAILCLCSLYLVLRFSAWNLRRTWQDRSLSPRLQRLKENLVKPVFFRNHLRRWLNWQLQRNPVGWLEQRTWSGRLVVWSWVAIVLCVYSSLFSNLGLYQRAFHILQTMLAILLASSLAVAAAGSFRRERETGVLELLLVAPMRESQIIAGRVRGLLIQFLPAIGLLLAMWLYSAKLFASGNEVPFVLGYVVTFATLPVIGLYFSLAKSNFINALVWTLLTGMVFPAAALILLGFDDSEWSLLISLATQAVIQLALAAVFGWRLLLLLRRRAF